MMLDNLFLKQYDLQNYNCSHFVIDAYKIITGKDISGVLDWKNIKSMPKHIFKIEKNIKDKTLLCFMSSNHDNHIGLLYKNKILHLKKNGVEYQSIEIATRFFKKIRFYSCNVL